MKVERIALVGTAALLTYSAAIAQDHVNPFTFDRFVSLRKYITYDYSYKVRNSDPKLPYTVWNVRRDLIIQAPSDPKAMLKHILSPAAGWQWTPAGAYVYFNGIVEEGFSVSRGKEQYDVDIDLISHKITIESTEEGF